MVEIIATVGPVSFSEKTMARMRDAGVDLFRLNLSHSNTLQEVKRFVELCRELGVRPCLDTQGLEDKARDIPNEQDLPQFTAFDRVALELGGIMGVDCVAVSFARSHHAATDARGLLSNKHAEVICKIESAEGVLKLKGILATANGVLIDRGDLGYSYRTAKIPFVQKHIVEESIYGGIPVYMATNFLESMVTSPEPTRAEVTDIVNAMLDGCQGLVLAGETAIGRYPVECVILLRDILDEVGLHRHVTYKSKPALGQRAREDTI